MILTFYWLTQLSFANLILALNVACALEMAQVTFLTKKPALLNATKWHEQH
jgi:hypothetical protein